MDAFTEPILRFALNFAVVFIIVRFIYYPQRRDKDYVFTFFAFNTIIFFLLSVLNRIDLGVGAGFGLFAIFSVLRYRTSTIPIREMTYLFVIIALPVVNAILLDAGGTVELLVANVATVGVMFVLEHEWGFAYENRKLIIYEQIDMIRPEHWDALLADLRERTGLPVKRIEIGPINFLRDTAEITVYYDAQVVQNGQVQHVQHQSADYTLEP